MSVEHTDLEDFLRELSRTVLEQLDLALASGALFRSSYESVEQAVSSYDYAIGMSEVHVELLPRSVEQWVWRDKGKYINDVMASCPGLAEGIASVIDLLRPGALDEDQASLDLTTQRAVDYMSTFVLALTDRLLAAGSEREGATDLAVQELIRDLRGDQAGWDVKAFVKCFWMEVEACALGEAMALRRPRLDDYRGRKCIEGVSCGGVRDVEVDAIGTSVGAIVDMRCPPSAEATAREELDAVLDAMLMFRVASLSKEHLEMRSRSVLAPHEVKEEDEGRPPLFHTVLRAEDLDDLRAFMSTMVPLVHHHPFQRSLFAGREAHTRNMLRIRQRYSRDPRGPAPAEVAEGAELAPGTDPGPVDIAFHLYRGALLDITTVEERLAKAVAGLEQLYLSTGTVVDRKRAVALRASSLLEGWGFDALKVARDIREGFKVKGDLYSSGALGVVYKDETLVLCEDLAEYLRASLVIFYQACASLPREELIGATDLLVQGKDLPEGVARVLEKVFLNESVAQPYR